MAVEWTQEQKDAIAARGSNILVAAAAGSGKTAVLVERIIRMITDETNPVSVDRLLVLTFTDAAASEMRRKIADAIDEKIEEEPDNERLREQSIRIGLANISTIHSFCSRILTNNAHLTDLPSEFSLIDDTENKVLQAEALDTVLESYYSRIDRKPAFYKLVHGWGGIKGDDGLRETILKLHDFSRSLAYPKKWLRDAWSDYDILEKGGNFEDTAWQLLLEQRLYSVGEKIYDSFMIIKRIVDNEIPTDHKYYIYYCDMADEFCRKFDELRASDETSAESLTLLLENLVIGRAPSKGDLDPEVVAKVNKIRDKYVKENLKEGLRFASAASDSDIIAKCKPMVKTLCSLVRQTERVHQRYKRERNAIDFSDLEHGMLRLIVNERGEETPLCAKLRDQYYEILLDEFQDTNILQFEIFTHLSKNEGNLFMVGDIKQCIYKFRNADPSIFMSLYKAYGRGNGGRLIKLFKNFRSRHEVVDSVNYVFSSVMSENLGGVDYTKDEYLIPGAKYLENQGCETEIILTDTSETEAYEESLADVENGELEAMNIAERIKKLVCVDNFTVTDKESGKLRPVEYGDITVLCRGSKECGLIEEALLRININTICDTGRSYLNSVEVSTILCFLQIIDNPIQDIPLIAVMRSAMFKFTADELAEIRICNRDGSFYDATVTAAEDNKKAAEFLSVLHKLRECSKYMGVDELVWKIEHELHYFSIVGAMPNGDLRQANLRLLLERCSDFEQGSLTGLFNFIKYIEMLKESNKDLAPAKEFSSNNDAVNIMTMHKSKGLEFPVTVLFGTAKKFFVKDIQKTIIWDEKLGIGLDYIDTRQRVRFRTSARALTEKYLLAAQKSEEMRLLYVAMTRAKEKLIISATVGGKDNKWKEAEFNEDGKLYSVFTDSVMQMRDWILYPLMNAKDGKALRDFAERNDIIPRIDADADFNISFANSSLTADEDGANATEKKGDKYLGNIHERLDYVYPYRELSRLPVKLSVSELKRRHMPEQDFSKGLLTEPTTIARDTSDIGAAEKGTITHFVLQHMDIHKTDTREEIEEQVKKMIQDGMITQIQADAVNIESIVYFFASDLGVRLKKAPQFEREFDFYMFVSPNEVDADICADGADDVILQGIADCFFKEDDGIVLIDYKTDRVGKGGVYARSEFYKMQIEYYAKGLAEVLATPVKEKYLYFLNCHTAVKM